MAFHDPFEKLYTDPRATLGLNIVSGIALLCAATWFSYTIFSARNVETPPRIVNSITLEPTIMLVGKPFKAHINVTLNKLCPYEVHWSLIRKDDHSEVVKIIEPVRQPPAQTGTQDLPVVERWVPASIGTGEFQYVSEVLDICPDGHTYVSVRRNVDLTIR